MYLLVWQWLINIWLKSEQVFSFGKGLNNVVEILWLASIVAPNNSRIYIEDNVKEADFVLSSVLGFEPCTFDPCVYPNTPLLLGMNVTLNNWSACSKNQPIIVWHASWYATSSLSLTTLVKSDWTLNDSCLPFYIWFIYLYLTITANLKCLHNLYLQEQQPNPCLFHLCIIEKFRRSRLFIIRSW